jgi:hypothetical protein
MADFSDEFESSAPDNREKDWEEYICVAKALIDKGCYEWLLSAIVDCFKFKNTFIVFDCPSGSGKTQTGIALLVLAEKKVMILGRELIVAHIVWPSAVEAQWIYQAIEADQCRHKVNVNGFFKRAQEWLKMPDRLEVLKIGGGEYKNHIWEHCLKYLFLDSTVQAKFMSEEGIFVLMWDEIPVESTDLVMIGELRDGLKVVKNIVIILSGTNSKAANMIGLSTGQASSSAIIGSGDYWSCIVTRMPKYDPGSSPHFQFWSAIQGTVDDEIKSVVRVISTSIKGDGNPRLINMAISALKTVSAEAFLQNPFTFTKWQEVFSAENNRGKFTVSRWSEGSSILNAQASLLLAASSCASLADAMIHCHYGQRAFPDRGKTACCSLSPKSKIRRSKHSRVYGGWLKISPPEWRCLGYSLYSSHTDVDRITAAAVAWQVTVFQPVGKDPLLYLGSCWVGGYFVISRMDKESTISHLAFTGMRLLTALWKSNAFGVFNFQNLQAPINTGSMVEVLVALSVMNAAAISVDPECSFLDFFSRFLSQLGIFCFNSPEMANDEAFRGVRIPRYVFPGTFSDCSVSGKIGIYERSADAENIDATLYYVQGADGEQQKVQKIFIEAKQRKSLPVLQVVEVIKKILKNENSIGIMVTSKSSIFKATGDQLSVALVHLQQYLNGTVKAPVMTKWLELESKLGVGYFVNVDKDGAGIVSSYTFDSSKQGRFILITLPELNGV